MQDTELVIYNVSIHSDVNDLKSKQSQHTPVYLTGALHKPHVIAISALISPAPLTQTITRNPALQHDFPLVNDARKLAIGREFRAFIREDKISRTHDT